VRDKGKDVEKETRHHCSGSGSVKFRGFYTRIAYIYTHVCEHAHVCVFEVFKSVSRLVTFCQKRVSRWLYNNIQYRKRQRRRRLWHLAGVRLNVFCLSVFRDFRLHAHLYTSVHIYTVYRIIYIVTRKRVFLYVKLCRWGKTGNLIRFIAGQTIWYIFIDI